MHTVALLAVPLLSGCLSFDKFSELPDAGAADAAGPPPDAAKPPADAAQSPDLATGDLVVSTAWRANQFGYGTLFAAWGPSASSVFFAADTGMLLRSADLGDTFAMVPLGTDFDLHGVWGPSATEVFVVGSGAFISHTTDLKVWLTADLQKVLPDSQPHFNAVWGAGANDVFVVGAGGVVLHSADGATWAKQASTVSADLFTVWGTGGDVWAAGDAGTLIHSSDGGANWMSSKIGAPTIESLWGSSATDLWAVGGATIFHSGDGGKNWTAENAPAALHAIQGTGPDDVWAVGSGGTILHRAKGAWMPDPSPVQSTLRGVFPVDKSVLAIGAAGVIARRQ